MEMKFVIEAQSSGEGQPLHVCISGGRLEILGFSHGKKVAIEEEYGKLTISLVEVFEAQSVQPVQSIQPVQSVQPVPAPAVPVQPQSKAIGQAVPSGQSLFDQLVALRKQIASDAKVPPYIIFHDSTLKEMSLSLPSSIEALSGIQGVGKSKLEKYGARFVEVIRQYAASSQGAVS